MRHRLRHQLVIPPVNSPFLSEPLSTSLKKNPLNHYQSSSNQRLVIGLVIEFPEGKLVNGDECDECDDSYTNTIH
jgi:hypothetical protein